MSAQVETRAAPAIEHVNECGVADAEERPLQA